MKDTIKAKVGYRLAKFKPERYGQAVLPNGEHYLIDKETRVLIDGGEIVMICQIIPTEECNYQKRSNECFYFQERFTTISGNHFEYYSDIETGEDFLVKIQ